MKVFFIKPGWADTNFPHQYAVLSAFVKKLGHSTNFYDASLKGESPVSVFKKIDFKDIDVICISVLTGWQNWVLQFTKLVKKKYNRLKIVVGGCHISALKEYAVEHIGADYGIVGEGEIPLGRLISNLDDLKNIKKIGGVIYRDKNSYKINILPYERIKNFDDIPLPDYKLIRPENYFHTYLAASVSKRHFRIVQTLTSRGCPYNCTFCATNAIWRGQVKLYSVDRVITEIKYLIKDFGIKEFWFGDDGFTMNRKRARMICESLIKENIKIAWRLPNGIRIDTIDDNLASVMRKAGCYMVGIGIETGSKRMLENIKKKINLDVVYDRIKILKKHNILASGYFIIGFHNETEEDLKKTVIFMLKSPLERCQICIFTPLPGSEDFNRIFEIEDEKKYAKNVRRYLYEEYIPEFLKYIDKNTIREYYRNTLIRFYLRPSVILSVLKNISLRQIRDIIKHRGVRRIFLESIFKSLKLNYDWTRERQLKDM